MDYNYFEISDICLDDWKKVFTFCLEKSDFFKIDHILNYEKFSEDNRMLFNNNNVKTEASWHFDYDRFRADEIDVLQKIYQYTLNKSDFLYLSVPIDIEFKALIDTILDRPNIRIKNLVREQKEYYEISGSIDEDSKKELLDIGPFDIMQKIKSEWRFRLISSFSRDNNFFAVQNYVGILLTDEDLEHFGHSNNLLRNKRLSSIASYGEMRKGLFDTLIEMFSLSITKPYDLNIPFFTDFILYKIDRQMLYFHFDTLFICLSDLELQELEDNYQVDITKWNLEQKRNIYQAPMDYFTLTAYDLW